MKCVFPEVVFEIEAEAFVYKIRHSVRELYLVLEII